MNKTFIIRHTAMLAALLCAEAVIAQNTPASVEKVRMESLWSATTDNAAGGMIDAFDKYATVAFDYEKVDGDFKYTQLGDDNNTLRFHTEGGGIYRKIGGMYLWGEFTYTRDDISGARWNSTLIDPLRGMPFFLADATPSKWKNQDYKMSFQAGFPKLLDRIYLGIGASYEAAQGAKQVDPRPLTKLSCVEVTPSIIVEAAKNHHIGANFYYRSYREDGSASCMNPVSQPVWEMFAPGYFTPGVLSNGGNTVNPLRSYNANTLGGGLQYGLRYGGFEGVLSGNYSYKVEDAFCNYTYPQMSGTVRENVWNVTMAVRYALDNGNLLIADFTHSSRSTDGIEYFQTFDNTYEIQSWITDAVFERSNFRVRDDRLRADYLVADSELAYKWKVGIEGAVVGDRYIYYLPESIREVRNFFISAHAARNLKVSRRSSFLLNLRADFRANIDNSFDYNGVRGDDIAFTEFALVDFDYMRCDYTKAGADLSYTLQGIFGKTSSLFAGLSFDYIAPSGDLFDKRQRIAAKIGLVF